MPLPALRRSPWLAGALLLVLAAVLAAPVAWGIEWRRWPLFAGIVAGLLLLFGWVERLWTSRPVPTRYRVLDRSRFRVVPGGKTGKANGHARDLPGEDSEDGRDKPRWLM